MPCKDDMDELVRSLTILGHELAKTPPYSWYIHLTYFILDHLAQFIDRITQRRRERLTKQR